jgi:pectinesterase
MEKLAALAFLLSAFLLLVLIFPRSVHGATITSCSQTPYPEICNHFINTNFLPSTLDGAHLKFPDLAHKVTMHQAIEAHQLISAMDTTLFNAKAKSAWKDCLELYEDTVNQINRSSGSNNPTDALTWISASIANQQTCRNGFTDFDMSSKLQSFPNMLTNFSKLLSNVLAVNKVSESKRNGGRRRLLSDGFPTWLSAADRKLLQSSGAGAPTVDAVVAQDGSGNYKTISEAVAAAGGGGRFIIHVKAGVYKENVQVKKSNIMIIGDGIGATIVTGSKNANGGSTTFGSATFGKLFET